jgi:hypothetical protein
MTRRSRLWGLAAGLYVAINVLGGAYALVMGELPHAALHVVLLFVGAAVWSRYAPAGSPRSPAWREGNEGARPAGELTDRFRNLEQSIDAVAIEVERIGEGQRFMTNLLADRDGPPASESSAPEPADIDRNRSSS